MPHKSQTHITTLLIYISHSTCILYQSVGLIVVMLVMVMLIVVMLVTRDVDCGDVGDTRCLFVLRMEYS